MSRPSKLSIAIFMKDFAFGTRTDERGPEVARILRDLADYMHDADLPRWKRGIIKDINGKNCGYWVVGYLPPVKKRLELIMKQIGL